MLKILRGNKINAVRTVIVFTLLTVFTFSSSAHADWSSRTMTDDSGHNVGYVGNESMVPSDRLSHRVSVVCINNRVTVSIFHFRQQPDDQRLNVNYRFDNGSVVETTGIQISPMAIAFSQNDSPSIVQKMIDGLRLDVDVSSTDGTTHSSAFDLRGFTAAFSKVCK